MSSSNRYLWVRSHRHHVPVGQQDPRRHSFTTSIYDKRAIDEKKAVSEIQCVPLLNVAATSRMHSAEIARMPRRRRRRRRRRYLPYADNNKHRTTSRLAHTSERCVFWFHTPIRALCCTVIAFAPFARDPRQGAVLHGHRLRAVRQGPQTSRGCCGSAPMSAAVGQRPPIVPQASAFGGFFDAPLLSV